jgi:hypothetical protein
MSGSRNTSILDKAENAVVYLYKLFNYATHPRRKVVVVVEQPRAKPEVRPTPPPDVEQSENEHNGSDSGTRHERRREDIRRRRERNIQEHRAHIRALREEREDLLKYGVEIDRLLHDQETELKQEGHDVNNLDLKD